MKYIIELLVAFAFLGLALAYLFIKYNEVMFCGLAILSFLSLTIREIKIHIDNRSK